ncbi:MAG TPA: phosphatase PAP2 family protein [Myxococcota bacterium]|jgi:undecaprenyl-diphosphatase
MSSTIAYNEDVVKLSRFARLVAFDDRLLRRLVRNRRARATFALRTLCRMYDPDMVIMAVAVALFAPSLVGIADHAALALISTSLLVLVVKRIVRRTRPAEELHSSAPPDRFSFPSGHTAAAFALAIAMFGAAPMLAPGLLLLAICVAYGRMYLGVHYPLDVAAGAAIGLVTGSIVALIEIPRLIPLPFTIPGL